MGLRAIGLEDERLSQMRQGFLVAPHRAQKPPELGLRHGIIGEDRDDLPVCLDRFRMTPCLDKNHGEILQSAGMFGFRLQNRPVVLLGFAERAQSVLRYGRFKMLPYRTAGPGIGVTLHRAYSRSR